MTLPQIELMLSDLPHTLYKSMKKDNSVKTDDEAIRLQEEANKKARERREKAKLEQSYTIEEVFAGKVETDEEQE